MATCTQKTIPDNTRDKIDVEFELIADYICNKKITSKLAYDTAKLALLDSIGCMAQALLVPEARKLLGPVVAGTYVPNGARVIGTNYILDPNKAAFDMGVLIRWLDYNDTWLAKEFGHPSDNFAAILSIADFTNRQNLANGDNSKLITMHDVLIYAIKAYEIQGIFALQNSFNAVGIDHVILVKLASTAVATKMLGGNFSDIVNAVSHVWLDGNSLRTYRHAPNTGSRKSWAAGDAVKRALELASFILKGEDGYHTSFSNPNWGFSARCFNNQNINISQDFASYVMENILFKVSAPAEFHAQTALELAIEISKLISPEKLADISKIIIETQEPGVKIISKTGPLHNYADRDHCLQYIVAVGLIYGNVTAKSYEDDIASNILIDQLRDKITVLEKLEYNNYYHDPEKRAIANSIKIIFNNSSEEIYKELLYPIGHRFRRDEAIPLLNEKFTTSINNFFSRRQADNIFKCIFNSPWDELPAHEFINKFILN